MLFDVTLLFCNNVFDVKPVLCNYCKNAIMSLCDYVIMLLWENNLKKPIGLFLVKKRQRLKI